VGTFTGELQSVDGYMNIALEKTEEYVQGVKKRSYGDAFVRGNNGKTTFVSLFKFPRLTVAQ
jgi:U6 snRNA-associated Sm-like protein LSm6